MVSEDFSNAGDGVRSRTIRFDQFATLSLLATLITQTIKQQIVISVLIGVAIMLGAGCTSPVKQPEAIQGQHTQSFEKKIQKTVHANYLLYLPPQYSHSKTKWPLILFLHGAGERGNDLELVKKHGPPKLAGTEGKDFPFIIVSPQCPKDEWWSNNSQIDTLSALLDTIVSQYRIDENRIYVTGISMGGFGTWRLAAEYPDRFAAIAPICGGGNLFEAFRIRHLPIWVFHGAKDKTVPVEKSEEMVNALKKSGADVKFTVYPEAGHDSWTETYNNPDLYQWFLQQKRAEKK